jgi:hypothetical protein
VVEDMTDTTVTLDNQQTMTKEEFLKEYFPLSSFSSLSAEPEQENSMPVPVPDNITNEKPENASSTDTEQIKKTAEETEASKTDPLTRTFEVPDTETDQKAAEEAARLKEAVRQQDANCNKVPF